MPPQPPGYQPNYHDIQMHLLRLSRSARLTLDEKTLLWVWKMNLGLSNAQLAKRLVLHRRDKAREYRQRRKTGNYNVYNIYDLD